MEVYQTWKSVESNNQWKNPGNNNKARIGLKRGRERERERAAQHQTETN